MATVTTDDELRARFEAAGQGHVFRFWSDLDDAARSRFRAELTAVDLELVGRLAGEPSSAAAAAERRLAPCEVFPRERSPDEEARARAAAESGAELFAAGRVGFVLVAGGQGSRLGFDGPKGAYEIGPVTGKSLFEWHAARIQATATRHGFAPRWYVMTSAANDTATREFFREHDHFGFASDAVVFFQQAMLPALDGEGRIVLADRGALFLAPNGHGGTLSALSTSGALDDMRRAGIEQLSYFQVDNPLARPGDTLFVGLHHLAGAEMSSKVVAKRSADEKVGVLGRVDGELGCIEYSDLSDELRLAKDESGALLFNAGNIAVHVIRRDFIEGLNAGGALDLPWHVARKKLRTIDAAGEPLEIDGVKFETFVFDALGKARESVVMEVDRAEEFSPVKNADGSDSPESCRADLSRIGREITGLVAERIEVDPRVAETAAEYRRRSPAPERTEGGLVLRQEP